MLAVGLAAGMVLLSPLWAPLGRRSSWSIAFINVALLFLTRTLLG